MANDGSDHGFMSLMEFNRELGRKIDDPRLRHILGLVWEAVVRLSQNDDEQTKAILQMATNMEGFMALHARTQEGLNILMQRGQTPGVEVKSVLNEPE